MDRETEIYNLKAMAAAMYKTRRDNEMNIRDIDYAFADEKIKYRAESVLRKANEDIEEIIATLEKRLSEIE